MQRVPLPMFSPMEAAIPKLTADQLDTELKLAERGAADGRRNVPASDDAGLSAIEKMVVSRIESAVQQKSSEVLGLGSGQDFTTLPQDLEAMASEPQNVLAQFRAKKARAQTAVGRELESAQTDYARAYRDYRSFRIQHKLTETEPSYDNVFWRKVFWLALLFTVEVAANGWMIGQASPGGLVQGWTTALMISVLVVLTGSLIGAGPWRYINYRGRDWKGSLHKLWAVPALVAGSALLLLFAFYIAHYRYALSQTTLDAPVPDNILTSIMTTPLQPFQQLESLLLFVIALLIGIFAIARGANWDDPYPGYGPRHRRLEDARDRAEDIAQRLAGDVDEAKAAADAALARVSTDTQQAVGALRQAIARVQRDDVELDYALQEIVAEGRNAIDLYRDANEAERTTPAPAYFSDYPFTKPKSSAQLLEELRSASARAAANITACKSQLAGVRAQLEAEYHSFYDDELGPLLRGILEQAKASVRSEFEEAPAEAPRLQRRPAAAREEAGREDKAEADVEELDDIELEAAPLRLRSRRRAR